MVSGKRHDVRDEQTWFDIFVGVLDVEANSSVLDSSVRDFTVGVYGGGWILVQAYRGGGYMTGWAEVKTDISTAF